MILQDAGMKKKYEMHECSEESNLLPWNIYFYQL